MLINQVRWWGTLSLIGSDSCGPSFGDGRSKLSGPTGSNVFRVCFYPNITCLPMTAL
jgi:hypothetical protein